MRLDRISKPYGKHGSMAGAGVTNLLGTPTIDPLTVLVRESVQNSWDARVSEEVDRQHPAPEWRIDFRTIDGPRLEALRELVGDISDAADGKGEHSLRQALAGESMVVIEISDWKTHGLGGPVDPSRIVPENESSDFVDFIFNTGSPRDTQHGGGTYGYGKAAFYRMSRCRTILVHTAVHGSCGEDSERLIASRIGDDYEERGMRYTGRHWWGQNDGGRARPIQGRVACKAAAAVGLPSRDGRDGSGTTILVLAALPDADELDNMAEAAVRSLLWNFWPKWTTSLKRPVPHMNFRVAVNGRPRRIPAPEEFAPLSHFVTAHQRIIDGSSEHVREIKRYSTVLGRLCFRQAGRDSRPHTLVHTGPVDTEENGIGSQIPHPCHHVALMRPVELVVTYLEGPAAPSDDAEYAGVFICSDEHEEIFARSEPPAHDDWLPDSLPTDDRRIVKLALRKIMDATRKLYDMSAGFAGSGDSTHLGTLASTLGTQLGLGRGDDASVIPGGGGTTPGGTGTGSGASGGLRGIPVFVRHELESGKAFSVFRQDVDSSATLHLRAEVEIKGTGSKFRPSDVGIDPIVPAWSHSESGPWSYPGSEWEQEPEVGDHVWIRVPKQDDLVIRLMVRSVGGDS